MIIKVLRQKIVFVKTKKEAIADYENFRAFLYLCAGIGLVGGLFYPPIMASAFALLLYKYFVDIHEEYFSGAKKHHYEQILQPVMTPTHYLQVGYEIPEDKEELDRHLAVMQKDDKSRRKELARLAKIVKKNNPERIVGFSKDILTRHAWILGATGAGKTSLLMTAFHHLFRIGAGVIFVDGKSDAKMFQKFYSLAYDVGREGDVFVINTLKPEETAFDTNTFSPIASLPAPAQVEFLASIASSGSSGDMKYWEGRGKSLLMPVVFTYALRKQFFGENYSYETIANAITSKEFSLLATMLYVLVKDKNRELEEDERLEKILREARRVIMPRDNTAPALESVVSYITQFPHKAVEVEELGYNRLYLERLYRTFVMAFYTYLSTLSAPWTSAVKNVAEAFYEDLVSTGTDLTTLTISQWREKFFNFIEEKKKDRSVDKNLRKNLETILTPPDKDLTQHQYAQQQWTNMFVSFDKYSHIFGSLDPDIDMLDIIRNNRLLYVLIPTLEQDQSTTELLGKSIVMAIKSASAVSLGGKLEGLSSTQQTIVNKIITPIPLGMVVLDEYGAYPVPGIDVITAQVRSLNISFWLATQDYTSARVGGNDENSVKRAWANTITKILMKLEDTEVKQKLAESVMKRFVATASRATRLDDKRESVDYDVSIQSEEMFDPKVTSLFKDGFCLIVSDGKPAYVQIFWADQKPIDKLFLNRFEQL